MRRSWYVFLLQLPLAEQVLRADDLALLDDLWAGWAPGHHRAANVARAKAALCGEADLPLAIRHYRTLFEDGAATLPPATPLLSLQGAQDGCIGTELITGLDGHLAPGSRVVVVPGAGHVPQLEAADALTARVLDWIG